MPSATPPPVPPLRPNSSSCGPSISVVMPYYHNARTLPRVLSALQAQSSPVHEVVIVDDGCDQQPAAEVIAAWRQAHPAAARWPLRCLRQAQAGQSAATNRGIAAATADVVLLTCSDIIGHRHWVAAHAQAHHDAGNDEIAVVGHLPYDPAVPMTPFMRYLANTRTQFSFDDIADPQDVSPLYCYAPNFSARRQSLQRAKGFDEAFVYGYQDTDLGKRLAAMGIRFVYRADALGYHDHPTTLAAFVRRQYSVGEATLTWLSKWRNSDELHKVRQVVATYLPLIPSFTATMANIARLEARLPQLGPMPAALQARLFELYTMVTNTAILVGMLQHRARLQALIGSDLLGALPADQAPRPGPTGPSPTRPAASMPTAAPAAAAARGPANTAPPN